jgi:hypothetical protein
MRKDVDKQKEQDAGEKSGKQGRNPSGNSEDGTS